MPNVSTHLASATITTDGDNVTVELFHPSGQPPVIHITWPIHMTAAQSAAVSQVVTGVADVLRLAVSRFDETLSSSRVNNHDIAQLAHGQLTVNDELEVHLIRPADLAAISRTVRPSVVRIIWPLQPTICAPREFPEVAAVDQPACTDQDRQRMVREARGRPDGYPPARPPTRHQCGLRIGLCVQRVP
jgi:hypothetical protein